jgi:hypothetical protein
LDKEVVREGGVVLLVVGFSSCVNENFFQVGTARIVGVFVVGPLTVDSRKKLYAAVD